MLAPWVRATARGAVGAARRVMRAYRSALAWSARRVSVEQDPAETESRSLDA